MGYDLEGHKTRQIAYLIFRKTDLLVVMGPWHADFLVRHLYREHHYTMLGLYHGPSRPTFQTRMGVLHPISEHASPI